MSFSRNFSHEQIWTSGFLMIIPLISNYKELDGAWFNNRFEFSMYLLYWNVKL